MALQFVLNIILAIIWMFLSGSYTFNNFLLGFLIGIGLVYLFKKVLPGSFYLKRVYKVIKLIVVFFIELMKANIDAVSYTHLTLPTKA